MKRTSSHDQDIHKILKEVESRKAAYPPELLAARRAAFLDQIAERAEAKQLQTEGEEELTPKDQQVIQLLQRLKTAEAPYPSLLMAARRAAYKQHVAQVAQPSVLQSLRVALQRWFVFPARSSESLSQRMQRSFAFAVMVMAAFVGFYMYSNQSQPGVVTSPQPWVPEIAPISASATSQAAIICKPGYKPPLCLAKEFDKSSDLSFAGNGKARPAVAKDTMPGYGEIHRASYVNDGLYGPGASWISNSPNSWIKIDLGTATTINTVAFGRDRLGQLNDRDPGQFVIAVALKDDVYADGNSSNDSNEYTQVFDSEQAGFDGTVSGAETVMAQFDPRTARYVKITFEKAGAAVDEVEIYLGKLPVPVNEPTKTRRDHTLLIVSTATSFPTSSPIPTFTRTAVPTSTPFPTLTWTPLPTDTAIPTDTLVPPTDTPPTDTPIPPTDTPVPPTDTPVPTDLPAETDTPASTPVTLAIDTPVPSPTEWIVATDTDTPHGHPKSTPDVPPKSNSKNSPQVLPEP